MLIEQARIKNPQHLLAIEFDILRIDMTKLSPDQRQEVLNRWFSYHLRCVDGNAHRWASHYWLSDLRAWLWGPCEKCGVSRLGQTNGNTIVWGQVGRHTEAFIMNKDFEKLERGLTKLWRHLR